MVRNGMKSFYARFGFSALECALVTCLISILFLGVVDLWRLTGG